MGVIVDRASVEKHIAIPLNGLIKHSSDNVKGVVEREQKCDYGGCVMGILHPQPYNFATALLPMVVRLLVV